MSASRTKAEPAVPRPETRLVVAAARAVVDAEVASRIREHLKGPLDWDAVLSEARANGVLPLLFRNLVDVGKDLIPEPRRQEMRMRFAASALHSLQQTRELLRILDLLAPRGVRAVPFKGPALGVQLYGDLTLRPSTDLDIVVRRGEIEAAKGALVSDGYVVTDDSFHVRLTPAAEGPFLRQKAHLNLARPDGSSLVELHHAFLPAYWSLRFRPEDIAAVDSMVLEGRVVPAFRPEDLLFVLAAHGSKHFWQRLVWVVDVTELIGKYASLDWGRVLGLASRVGALRMVHLALVVARDLLRAPVPPEIISAATADRTVVSLASEVLATFFSVTGDHESRIPDENLFYFRLREQIRDRIPFFLHYVARPNEKDRSFWRLPHRLESLYWLLRPLRLALETLRHPSRLLHLLGLRRR